MELFMSCNMKTMKRIVNILEYNGDMGLSENSVPLNPMVNDHYPY